MSSIGTTKYSDESNMQYVGIHVVNQETKKNEMEFVFTCSLKLRSKSWIQQQFLVVSNLNLIIWCF